MTNLAADYGRLICGSFRPYQGDTKTYRIDETPAGRKRAWDDSDLAIQIRDEIESNVLIVSYNGVMFDLKFLDSRLMHHRERVMRRPLHKDLLWTAKTAFALSSNRLATVQEHLHLTHEKTRLDPEMWVRAAAGDLEAIAYVVEHCEADVAVLEEVFEYLIPFVKEVHA